MTRKRMSALIGAVGAALLLTACASSSTPGPRAVDALPAVNSGLPAPGGAGWQWGSAEDIMAAQPMPDAMMASTGSATPAARPTKEQPKAVTLMTSQVTLATGDPGPHTAFVTLTCFESGPSLGVAWNVPVGATGQSAIVYGFTGQQPHTVAAAPVSPKAQVVIDPLAVARFLDEAALSQELVVRLPSPAGGTAEARFDANDSMGNLKRFRAVCPTGTN